MNPKAYGASGLRSADSVRQQITARTDAGGRSCNQDAFRTEKFGSRAFCVVCDGLGAYAGSEFASERTAAGLLRWARETGGTAERLAEEIERLHRELIDYKTERETGKSAATTVCALMLEDRRGYFAAVGDTRLYFVRGGRLTRLSTDDSLAQQQVDAGILSEKDIRKSIERHSLTAAVGSGKIVPGFGTVEVERGDRFIICTDGFWEHLTDREISDSRPAKKCFAHWARRIRARGGRRRDNWTAVVVDIE